MAATGYTPILLYSSSTASTAPSASNLTNSTLGSELAINITDGKLFYKDNGGNVQVIGWKTVPTTAGGTGLTSYTAGDILYYASGTALSKLSIGANTTILTSTGSAPQWTSYLSIAQGGTNATSFTGVSGTISGLTYYNGTSIVNGSTVTDVGFDTTNLNIVARGYALSSNGIITESTTSRTLSASDNGKIIYCTNASTTTITTATGLGAGYSITIIQGGAGKVTVAQGASTTLVSYSSLFSTMGQYAVISLVAPVANTFIAAGNLGV
jgi:hypothetical protein